LVGYWTWHTAHCDRHSIKLTLFIRNESEIKALRIKQGKIQAPQYF
jgi:hypothetical protein